MHEMQTIVTDVCSVCLSQWLSYLGFAVQGSFSAAFAKLLWPGVIVAIVSTEASSKARPNAQSLCVQGYCDE